MKYLHYFFILITFFNVCIVLGQNENNKKNVKSELSYNLPPGAVLKHKTIPIDLSYKLEGRTSAAVYSESDLNVIKDFSQEELENLKNTDIAYHNYYTNGLSFFRGLSDKVKRIYSEKELWYIYVFDQKLKNKLTTVK
nr:hypothetical protein [uncultured Flavobacterium sp.]